MLDDDFKEIEDFLKVGGNLELQTLQKFEVIVNDFIDQMMQKNIKESFVTLNTLVFHSYEEFEKSHNSIIQNFAITIFVIKKLVEVLLKEDTILSEIDKTLYIQLIKSLMGTFKEELNSHLSFFNEFTKYINEVNNLLEIKD